MEDDAQRCPVYVIAGALSGRAQDELLAAVHKLVPTRNPFRTVSVANPEIRRDDADPRIFAEIEFDLVRLDDGLGDETGIEYGHYGTIPRRGQIEIAHRSQAPGAWHVLHDNIRIAWNVLSNVSRHIAGISIVASPRGKTDDDGEALALIEIVGARRRHSKCPNQHDGNEMLFASEHHDPPGAARTE